MVAEVEQQRVALMGERSWLEWRAVCRDHGFDNLVPNWMGKNTRKTWIEARFDAVEHNLTVHGVHYSHDHHD